MAECLISIGSNLGDRSLVIDSALAELQSNSAILVRRVSRPHTTLPIGGPAGQDSFVNAAAHIETSLSPTELMTVLHELESRAGRTRAVRWGSRSLDLDLLLYDDVILNEELLVVPHPRMAFRRFVLAPAAEIAPQMLHPLLRRSISQLLAHLEQAPNYVAITGSPKVGKSKLAEAVAARTKAMPVLERQSGWRTIDSTPSPSLQAELEFLRSRCELLRGVTGSRLDPYAISDFWLRQCFAYANELHPEELEQLEAALLDCGDQVVAPKLIVIVEWDLHGATPDEQTEAIIQIQRELRKQLLGCGQPPSLRLDAANASWNEEEVVAAILAM